MKVYDSSNIRNVALFGSPKSGKTTLTETLLFQGGLSKRRGSVEDKNAVSDFHDIEHERGNSVYASTLFTQWKEHKINMIDVPGFDDFVGETYSSIKIADTCLFLINAQQGLEVATEVIWNTVEKFEKPTMFAINHLDHSKSQFEAAVKSVKERFPINAALFQYPVNEGESFSQIIDLIDMKMYEYPAGGGNAKSCDIPEGEKEKAEELRAEFIEKVAESDEELMEIYFDQGTLTEQQIKKGLKTAVTNREIFPIVCVSAKSNIGADKLLDYICSTTPNPTEVTKEKTKDGEDITCSNSEKPVVFVFKTIIEPHFGKLTFFKVITGELNSGTEMVNSETGNSEKINQIFWVNGRQRTSVDKLSAGDIAASVKLKTVKTNQSMCAKGVDLPVAPIEFPGPRIQNAIEAESKNDDEKLVETLREMMVEDPTILVEYSKELKQLLLSGQGELHLDICRWKLNHYDKIQSRFVKPKVAYRETIQTEADASYRHKKQSGGAGQFGEVHMKVLPYTEGMEDPKIGLNIRAKDEHILPWGGKLVFYNCIVGGVIDARYIPAILKGIMTKLEEGPITGSYARDVCVMVYDGKMHPVDSNEISFKIAGAMAFRDAFLKAKPRLLEPVYELEVMVPEDLVGDVMGDLQGRRSVIQGIDSKNNFQVVRAKAPQGELYKYSTSLKSMTQGRAGFSTKFSEYAPVPSEIQKKLAEEYLTPSE